MKFLKFSMLMTYFALEKNSKRALLIINVGIFLSIFACSAAFISLYIENKVSQFEFLHLEESKYKREMERTIQLIPTVTGELRQMINIEETNQEFSELMRFNNFGKLIISSNDIQASGLYEITYTIKDFDEYMEIFDLYVKDEEYLKEVLPVYHEEFKQLVKETKKNLNILRKLEDKEKIFENILYNRSYDDLFDELLVSLKESTKKKQNLKFIGEYSKEFLLAEKIVDQFYELIEYTLLITSSNITYSDIALEDINNEIKYFSKLEKNLILSAFILQLSIFIIIQFFEISSVNFNLKGMRKKIK